MLFYLTTLNLRHVITSEAPKAPEEGDIPVEILQAIEAWTHSEFLCRNYILNALNDSLYDVYSSYKTSKELLESLDKKHKSEVASSKKFHLTEDMSMDQLILKLGVEEDHRKNEKYDVSLLETKANVVEGGDLHKARHHQKKKGKDAAKKGLTAVKGKTFKKIEESCWVPPLSLLISEGGVQGFSTCSRLLVGGELEYPKFSIPTFGAVCGKHTKSRPPALIVDKRRWCPRLLNVFKISCWWRIGVSEIFHSNIAVVSEVNLLTNSNDWWVDTGATRHVCANLNLFVTYQSVVGGENLYMGNATASAVAGKGKVMLKLTSGKELSLTNVLHVPDIRKNLISGSLLSSKGFKIVFESDKFVITKEAEFFEEIFPYKDRSYVLNKRVHDVTTRNDDDNHASTSRVQSQDLEPQKSKRAKIAKDFGPDFLTFVTEEEPQTYKAVLESSEAPYWNEAIQSEIESIMQSNTWELVNLPPGNKLIGHKWIFKRKLRTDGTIDKYKARLVAKGYRQKEGLDYFDTYSPVARITSIRLLIAIAFVYNLEIHQMDVKTTLLNGELDEEIYMEQPEGFIVKCQEKKVHKLIKSLYGLKQAPKQWHEKFDHNMITNGFVINESDKCIYVKQMKNACVIVCLYVDDMLIMGTNKDMINSTKKMLNSSFDMKDMGLADVILGVRILRNSDEYV
ncbi:uncharacterized protein [Pyrus communis]|uniref:uncharacterized protein n=1 Tax=Pyrus communis TaxID=23211 RepID=UPI0035C05E36